MHDWEHEIEELSSVVGKTPTDIWQVGDDELYMKFSDGYILKLYHSQDCCESVEIDDVSGDWHDLIGKPLIVAESRTSEESPNPKSNDDYWDESNTWTFYTFRGNGGSVDMRWHGSSNGYYSEEVRACLFAPAVAQKRNLNPPTEQST